MDCYFEKPAEPVYYNKDWGFSSATKESRAFREGRRDRRREKMNSELVRIYRRLMTFDNGDGYLDAVFESIGVSSALREEYKKTHKVVGPGATVARDYVSVWISPADSRSGRLESTSLDYSSVVNHTLENFVKEQWYRHVCGADAVDDVAEIAVIEPHVAAKQAQAMLRRGGYKKCSVVCAEFVRSKNVCSKTIATFANELGVYADQIRCYVDGNWAQLIGPNGLGDWEIAAHISQMVAARDLYNVMTKIGYDNTMLLLDNEISVLNIFVSRPLGNVKCVSEFDYEPYCDETESESKDSSSGSCSFGTLTAIHDEVILSMNTSYRTRLDELTRCLSVLSTKKGKGHKLHIGANAAISVNHLLEPGNSSGKVLELDNGIVAVSERTGSKPAWRFRDPRIGEICYLLRLVNNKPLLSERVWVTSIGPVNGYLTTTKASGVKKGDSGCALISGVDLSLLGVLQGLSRQREGRLVFSAIGIDWFWALAMTSTEIDLSLPVTDGFAEIGLGNKLLDIVRALNYGIDSATYFKTGPGWLYKLKHVNQHERPTDETDLNHYKTRSMTLFRHRFPDEYKYVDTVVWRLPKHSEKVIGISRSLSDNSWVSVGPYTVSVDNEHMDEARLTPASAGCGDNPSVIIAVTDCALLGFCFPDKPSVLCSLTQDFGFSEDDIILPKHALGFIGQCPGLRRVAAKDAGRFVDIWTDDDMSSALVDEEGAQREAALGRLKIGLGKAIVFEAVPWCDVFKEVHLISTKLQVNEKHLLNCLAKAYLFYEDYGEAQSFIDELTKVSLEALIS